MSMIERGGYAMVSTALLTGVGAWGLNQLGLAKKVMRTTAPHFIDACKYGLVRGAMTFGITAVSVCLHQSVKDEWAKVLIGIAAVAGLYFSVPYTRQLAKDHLGVRIPEQFTYLALLAEFGSIYYNRSK